MILYGSSTAAQQQGRDIEKEKAIWAELETYSPTSVADFKAATEAMDAQDYNKAVMLFQAAATGMVWDLFKNREALTNEMTSLIQSEVQSG